MNVRRLIKVSTLVLIMIPASTLRESEIKEID
jgi:hypothetical protein